MFDICKSKNGFLLIKTSTKMIHMTRKIKILNKNQQHLENNFNSQNLTGLSRRIMFVNALKSPDYELLYLTETWLTLDILLAVLLLNAQ